MKINLKFPPIFKFTSAIYGELVIGHLTIGDLSDLEKKINNDEIDKQIFLHYFASLVICRQNPETEKEEEVNKELRLSQEEVEALPPDEFDLFCQEYIKHYESQEDHDPLTCDEEKQSAEDYLYCLVKNEFNGFLENTKNLIKKASGFATSGIFSDNITKQFSKASTVSKTLGSSLSKWEHYSKDPALKTTIAHADSLSKIDPKHFRSPVEDTNNLLQSLIEYQKNISPVIIDTASLLKEMHDLGRSVATDLKYSSKKTSFYSLMTIVIASLTLIATCVFSYMSYKSSINTGDIFVKTVHGTTEAINNLNSSYSNSEQNIQSYVLAINKNIAFNQQRLVEIKNDESINSDLLRKIEEQNLIYLKTITEILSQIRKEQKSNDKSSTNSSIN